MTDADVVVIGGGPAGSSAAWHLATAGVRVLLLDRARFPRPKPCSEYLSPEASRILHVMGALGACESAGAATLAGMVVWSPSGATLRGDFAGSHGFRGFRDHGLALRREVLDAILLERARVAGARVLEGERVTDLTRDSRGRVCGVRATDTNGTTREWRAPLVIAADGLRSIAARRLRLAHFARRPRRLALVSHYEGVRELGDHGEMHVTHGGYTGIAPVGGGIANVAVVVPAAAARRLAGDATGFFERWLRTRPDIAPRFVSARRVSPVRVTGPFAQRATRAWAPGVALTGDAADFFDPFTGEGIYAALRGGELLSPFALEALSSTSVTAADGALAQYDAARHAEFAGKWAVERLVGLAVATPFILDRVAIGLGRRKDLADILVGVTGDFVPPREVLRLRFALELLAASLAPTPRVPVRSAGTRPPDPEPGRLSF